MKPEWGIILGWILLVARAGAARRGSPEEASFYYGPFPPGMSSDCLSIHLLVSVGFPTLVGLTKNWVL